MANTFGLDPLVVLDSDGFTWDLRAAAHNVIAAEEKAAADKAKRKAK